MRGMERWPRRRWRCVFFPTFRGSPRRMEMRSWRRGGGSREHSESYSALTSQSRGNTLPTSSLIFLWLFSCFLGMFLNDLVVLLLHIFLFMFMLVLVLLFLFWAVRSWRRGRTSRNGRRSTKLDTTESGHSFSNGTSSCLLFILLLWFWFFGHWWNMSSSLSERRSFCRLWKMDWGENGRCRSSLWADKSGINGICELRKCQFSSVTEKSARCEYVPTSESSNISCSDASDGCLRVCVGTCGCVS